MLTESEFFASKLGQLEFCIVDLTKTYPDDGPFILRRFLRFLDDLGRSLRDRIAPEIEMTPILTQGLLDTVPSVLLPSTYLDQQFDDNFPLDNILNNEDLNFSPSTGASSSVDRIASMNPDKGQCLAVSNDVTPRFGNAECSAREITRMDGNPRESMFEQEPSNSCRTASHASLRPRLEVGDNNRCGMGSPPKDNTSVTIPNKDRPSRKRTAEDYNSSTPAQSRHKRQKRSSGCTNVSANHAATRSGATCEEQTAHSDDTTKKLHLLLLEKSANNSVGKAPKLLKFIYCLDNGLPLRHLCDTLRTMRKEKTFHFAPASCDIAATSAKLDELDHTASTCCVLRRFYLVRLLEHRGNIMARLKCEMRKPNTAHSTKGTGKVATRVHEHLLKDMYPAMDGGKRRVQHKHLHNKLTTARNWMFVRANLSLGMLFLIPAGNVYGVNHHEYVHNSMSEIELTNQVSRLLRNHSYQHCSNIYRFTMETPLSSLRKPYLLTCTTSCKGRIFTAPSNLRM